MTQYDVELSQLASTYERAIQADVSELKRAIAGASESSIIGVGSGGSFTVATLLSNLHEAYTGRVSRAATPLEIICNPTLAASSPVFFISAEGKNPDIVEALDRARQRSSRPIHVLTNRKSSPLMERAAQRTGTLTHVFQLADKDGYLATNSLLLDAVLVARAYSELDGDAHPLPDSINDLEIGGLSIDARLADFQAFSAEMTKRKGVIVVYAPLLKPVAADFESKLSESALLYSQIADLRSFAHGRHIWLSKRPTDCAVLAITDPALAGLWAEMRETLPADVATFTLGLSGSKPRDLITGLVAQMKMIGLIAKTQAQDPARPSVPDFGRTLYYLDLTSNIPSEPAPEVRGLQPKYESMGVRWPTKGNSGSTRRALLDCESAFQEQDFRAIVFDYDGTLRRSNHPGEAPTAQMIERLEKIADSGIVVGIASGRGDGIQSTLREKINVDFWSRIELGLFNGGWLGTLDPEYTPKETNNEFLSHVTRILRALQSSGVPIREIKPNFPYQISVRFHEGVQAEGMWFVIADGLRQAGLNSSTVVRSKHSVDVVSPGISKTHLIASIIRKHKIDPYQIVTMGDQGSWPGNDCSLLEHKYSLSVDEPSRRLDRGWKLAPDSRRDVDATMWYLDRMKIANGQFRFHLS